MQLSTCMRWGRISPIFVGTQSVCNRCILTVDMNDGWLGIIKCNIGELEKGGTIQIFHRTVPR